MIIVNINGLIKKDVAEAFGEDIPQSYNEAYDTLYNYIESHPNVYNKATKVLAYNSQWKEVYANNIEPWSRISRDPVRQEQILRLLHISDGLKSIGIKKGA